MTAATAAAMGQGQMNPFLVQQQMIQNMQFSNHLNFYANHHGPPGAQFQGRGRYNNKKKYEDRKQNDPSSTDSSNTAGEGSKDPNALVNQQYDQKELLERLELMLKVKKEKEGGDFAGMTQD